MYIVKLKVSVNSVSVSIDSHLFFFNRTTFVTLKYECNGKGLRNNVWLKTELR